MDALYKFLQKVGKWIIGFVSLIGISFIFELSLVDVKWTEAVVSWVKPEFPPGSMPIIMSVLVLLLCPTICFYIQR